MPTTAENAGFYSQVMPAE
jgi:hypothetical protein